MAKKWGPWENISELGRGGQGHVFKVKNTETQELGALKQLLNPKRLPRFTKEIESLRQLNHPHVARLIDTHVTEEPFFAVYEFVDGGSVGDLLQDELSSIPIGKRLEWCEQLCDALSAAHELGLVHRDVKPDNLLISSDRELVKLTDFGLVYVEDEGRVTATMEQVGSRFFIPPECEEGRQSQVGPQSDLYCVGKVLYYVTSGGLIFARENHRREEHDLATVTGNRYTEHVSRILDQTITEEITERVESAGKLKELIHAARQKVIGQLPGPGMPSTYICVFCGVGRYELVGNSDRQGGHNLGYGGEGNIGNHRMVFLECPECGNCQRFKTRYKPEWFESKDNRT